MSNTLKEKCYIAIRKKILQCEYPPNSYLNEKLLCEELNVSRTPVRDAISRLEQEQLVEILPKKGILVAPLSIKEINMIYETRILLEPYVILNYGNCISKEEKNKFKDNLVYSKNKINDIESLNDLDDEFHHLIIGLCKNKYFLQCYSNIHAQNYRLRVFSGKIGKDRQLETYKEHKDIVNFILEENYIEAGKAMESHLLASKDAAYKAVYNTNLPI